ncbi:secreted acidic protein 1A-like isoform X2 [Hyalella azteca]|uniref:Secreted acidic protein 1A-like isoform X2 n=1 Tax=Hyalella azteca TaxID=294128 RepID=A0A8B7NM42_HYAAZ|nr:secreted acidic protein 1A-like isoform X2 [Hyalella azteca]
MKMMLKTWSMLILLFLCVRTSQGQCQGIEEKLSELEKTFERLRTSFLSHVSELKLVKEQVSSVLDLVKPSDTGKEDFTTFITTSPTPIPTSTIPSVVSTEKVPTKVETPERVDDEEGSGEDGGSGDDDEGSGGSGDIKSLNDDEDFSEYADDEGSSGSGDGKDTKSLDTDDDDGEYFSEYADDEGSSGSGNDKDTKSLNTDDDEDFSEYADEGSGSGHGSLKALYRRPIVFAKL